MNRANCLAVTLTVGLGSLLLLTTSSAGDRPRGEPTRPEAGSAPTRALGPAVKPKPLNATVKKGLEYLVKHQDQRGGWGQGGGWRVAGQGGRVEGPQVQDPPDVGNTCAAVLAL